MPLQDHWGFCRKCFTMYFDGSGNKGVCPAGDAHKAQGYVFTLPFDEPETGTAQRHWRFCQDCSAMFFNGDLNNKGVCPTGNGHTAQGFEFTLPHNVPPSALAQDQWRFCQKCFSMFFDGDQNTSGVCPAGDQHEAQGFMFVLPHGGFGDTLDFDSGPVTSDLALGGNAQLVISKNGDWTYTSHAHDSGAEDIDYLIASVLMASDGQAALVTQSSGRVEGTLKHVFGGPRRNDDQMHTDNEARITKHWDAIVSGNIFRTKLVGAGEIHDAITALVENALQELAKEAVAELISLVAA